ncbi:hypothetical protein NliqN6_6602 [Naganishia liquefaciens]|uniref:Uncharacterized protein n=1 Tax=Naganishia liquefaciens TaxID=104408 RepID=A0A8H3TZR7_9TREE|nr:hypothetical protein NliqN6_6602 [Naganishia liquefaciens]
MIATAKADETTALELAHCVGWSVQAIKTRSCRTLDVRALRESSIISTELFNQLRKGLDCLGDKPASDLSREMMQGGLHFYEYSRTYRDLYPLNSVTSSSLSLDDIAAQLNETLLGLTATSLVQPTVTISVGGLSFEVRPSVEDEARQASTTEILELLNLSDVSAGDIQSLMTVLRSKGVDCIFESLQAKACGRDQ